MHNGSFVFTHFLQWINLHYMLSNVNVFPCGQDYLPDAWLMGKNSQNIYTLYNNMLIRLQRENIIYTKISFKQLNQVI